MPFPGRPLQARYYFPYTVDKKLSDIIFIVNTLRRRNLREKFRILYKFLFNANRRFEEIQVGSGRVKMVLDKTNFSK